MKVVINDGYGGFGLSEKAWLRLRELGHEEALAEEKTEYFELYSSYCSGIKRNDPLLLQVLAELGLEACSGDACKLKIVEIPDDSSFAIHECDNGAEMVYDTRYRWY